MPVSLPCSVQISETIWKLELMFWTNEISWDLIFRILLGISYIATVNKVAEKTFYNMSQSLEEATNWVFKGEYRLKIS